MRVLLVSDDPELCTLLQHHVSCRWPAGIVQQWSPSSRGALPPELLAQGYSAVLLAAGSGYEPLELLRELGGRAGFAPLLLLSDEAGSDLDRRALALGAGAVLPRKRIAHAPLISALDQAAERQHRAQSDWRVSPAASEARRFGDANIPGYRRARLLARGSVSQLYVAESDKVGELVVLKVTPSTRDESGVDQVFERFLMEYEIAQRIRHPNIVRLHELGVADDHAYLAMEYFPLGDFRRLVRGGLAPGEALQFAAQIARVLAALHAGGVLHRDLKPGNIMLRTPRDVALIDFGLAKQSAYAMELTDAGLIFGTPQYMSPEQGHGQKLDARSDLYSLGVVFYEMLTGLKPYVADNPMTVLYMHRNAPLPVLPEPLRMLQETVNRLMAKEPEDRFADGEAAARALDLARERWLNDVAAA